MGLIEIFSYTNTHTLTPPPPNYSHSLDIQLDISWQLKEHFKKIFLKVSSHSPVIDLLRTETTRPERTRHSLTDTELDIV